MNLSSKAQDDVTIVEPVGVIAKRAAREFERAMLDLLDDGQHLVAVDLSKIDLIASEGIRVLMLLSQRLETSGGRLVLCALSQDVLDVFDVTGLRDRFQIVETPAEAIARLSSSRDDASAPARSTVTRLIGRLLDSSTAGATEFGSTSGQPSRLTREVGVLLSARGRAPGTE